MTKQKILRCVLLFATMLSLMIVGTSSVTVLAAEAYDSTTVAVIGNEEYSTLTDAVSAAQDGDTITLTATVKMIDILTINKGITLDGNGNTLLSTAERAINVSGATGVTIKNLTIFVCICTVITVLLATTNAITAPTIQKNQNALANKALLEVMPDGTGFEVVDTSSLTLPATVTEVHKEQSDKGHVIKLVTAGYGTDMVIMCGVDATGVVTGAVCLSSNETLGKEKTYGENFTQKDAAGVEAVDTIAGATKTTA
ncbi:MAG: FMN-binding protein, partial [Clostridia bacterium]|nr:FMN-binding protein [Clostridia bacterium]